MHSCRRKGHQDPVDGGNHDASKSLGDNGGQADPVNVSQDTALQPVALPFWLDSGIAKAVQQNSVHSTYPIAR